MKKLNQFRFAECLTKAIREKGYTVKDVADYLNISVQAVYGWIYGTKMPKIDNLVPLADLVDKRLDELIPTCESEWVGQTLNGRNIEQRRLQERTVNKINENKKER